MAVIDDYTFLKVARTLADISQCKEQVGCVIVKDNRIVSTGVNGSFPGYPNNPVTDSGKSDHKRIIHAEMNAIMFALRHNIDVVDAILYCTKLPCFECTKLIKIAGIKRVYAPEGPGEYYDLLREYCLI